MIFFSPIVVKYMKKNLHMMKLFIANKCCQSLGPLLNRGSTVHDILVTLKFGEFSDFSKILKIVKVKGIKIKCY